MRVQNHSILALFLLFSCASQVGVDASSREKKTVESNYQSANFSLHGHWEAREVNQIALEKLSQEEIPFRMLFLGEDGTMRMDNFLTEYDLLSVNGKVFSLLYSVVGENRPFRVEFVDTVQAHLFLAKDARQQGEVQVLIRKMR